MPDLDAILAEHATRCAQDPAAYEKTEQAWVIEANGVHEPDELKGMVVALENDCAELQHELTVAQNERRALLAVINEWASCGYIDNTAATYASYKGGALSHDEWLAELRAAQNYVPEGGGV